MFGEMKYDLELIYNDPFERNAFDAFNFLVWEESKVKGIGFLDAVKELKERK